MCACLFPPWSPADSGKAESGTSKGRGAAAFPLRDLDSWRHASRGAGALKPRILPARRRGCGRGAGAAGAGGRGQRGRRHAGTRAERSGTEAPGLRCVSSDRRTDPQAVWTRKRSEAGYTLLVAGHVPYGRRALPWGPVSSLTGLHARAAAGPFSHPRAVLAEPEPRRLRT